MRVAYATLDEAAAGPSAADPAWARLGLDELLSSSDVVSLHVPLTPSTRHLIDRRAILRMKRRVLINTSRGPVVDEEALAWALRERLLAGAAPDGSEEPRVHRACWS